MKNPTELIDRYIAIWNEADDEQRRQQIAHTWAPNAIYRDPLMQGDGHAGIDTMVQAVQQRFPGHRFHRTSAVDVLHDHLRFNWKLVAESGATVVSGGDFGVVNSAGLLQSIIGFLDSTPDMQSRTQGWTVDRFAAFWAKPDASLVPRAVTADVTGYWPSSTEPVRGADAYTKRIADLIDLVPDIRLEVAEHAENGDFTFVRWIAHGTGKDGPFQCHGVDRIRLREGLVAENMIFSDHRLFQTLARHAAESA